MTRPVLQVAGLRFERQGDPAFAIEVDALALGAGEAIGVVGPSGCGKSTLVDLFALLRRPTAARRFELLGEDVAALWRAGGTDACTALRAARIGVVLQSGGLLASLPVRENVLLAQRLLGRPDTAWADRLLGALGLQALAGRLPAQLSMGQRQRVAIARALAHRPALLLADEPTASLGVEHAPAVMDLMLDLVEDSGTALVVVSHDIALLHAKRLPLHRCVSKAGTVRLQPVAAEVAE